VVTVAYATAFNYRDLGNGSFPVLQVELVNPADPEQRVDVDAYLDTGASRSVFFGWIPAAIGLDLLHGQPLSYLNNMGQEQEGRVLPVTIRHPDLGQFTIELGFALWEAPRSLLGRDFLNLVQIGFRERQLEFYIEPNP
jgi:hypothetical protein